MLAFIRLLHCLNCINEVPDCQSMYNDLLSFSSVIPSLENYITDIQELYGDYLKDCISGIVQCLGSINRDVEGEVYNIYKVFQKRGNPTLACHC